MRRVRAQAGRVVGVVEVGRQSPRRSLQEVQSLLGAHPEPAGLILQHDPNGVVAEAGGIFRIDAVAGEAARAAIEREQPGVGPHPDRAPTILMKLLNDVSLVGIHALDFVAVP
jgi:hypothetical protein